MKKTFFVLAAMLFPLLAGAATLNNSFSINTLFPLTGGTAIVSSTCGSLGANSTVSFALVQNGVRTQLSTSLLTDSSGAFSGNVTFPALYGSDPATLVANCDRTGDTINSPLLTFASPASSAFNLQQAQPTVGGIFNVSGACGNSGGVGSVQLNLSGSNSNYSLNNFSLNAAGAFSGSVIIPNSINTGQATLTAVCSNGTRFSSNLNIGPAAVNSFAFGSSPAPGSHTSISGSCTNVSKNANKAVTFAVMRNGIFYTLPPTGNQTNANGSFNASVLFPTNVGSDPAALIVTCPDGSTFSNVIMLGAVSPAISPNILGANTTPVGGVDAGYGPQSRLYYFIAAEFALILGLVGLLALKSRKIYAKK